MSQLENLKKAESEDLNFDYGVLNTEVKAAIVHEYSGVLDTTNLPIHSVVSNIDLKSNDEYVLLRKQYGWGASESSILLGVNPYQNLEDTIKQKASLTISAEERAVGELAAVKKGLDLEPVIMHKHMNYFGTKTFKPDDMYQFNEYPWLCINFDGMTHTNGQYVPVEIKVVTAKGQRHYNPLKATFSEERGFQAPMFDISGENASIQTKAAHYGIPPYYYTQLQQQIAGCDAPFGYLSVLFEASWRFYSFLIWRDQAVFSDLIIQGYKAWEKVLAIREQEQALTPPQAKESSIKYY